MYIKIIAILAACVILGCNSFVKRSNPKNIPKIDILLNRGTMFLKDSIEVYVDDEKQYSMIYDSYRVFFDYVIDDQAINIRLPFKKK